MLCADPDRARVSPLVQGHVEVRRRPRQLPAATTHWARPRRRGVLNLVKLLLDSKAQVDVTNQSGATPLHCGANNGSVRGRAGGSCRALSRHPKPTSTPMAGVVH